MFNPFTYAMVFRSLEIHDLSIDMIIKKKEKKINYSSRESYKGESG